jgi:hypothetical protein
MYGMWLYIGREVMDKTYLYRTVDYWVKFYTPVIERECVKGKSHCCMSSVPDGRAVRKGIKQHFNNKGVAVRFDWLFGWDVEFDWGSK